MTKFATTLEDLELLPLLSALSPATLAATTPVATAIPLPAIKVSLDGMGLRLIWYS